MLQNAIIKGKIAYKRFKRDPVFFLKILSFSTLFLFFSFFLSFFLLIFSCRRIPDVWYRPVYIIAKEVT